MYSYIIRRLAFGALTVIGVSIIVFMVLRILPGDPLVAIFGPEGYSKLSEAERAHYMAELGLSDPLVVQYLHWVGDIARGNFGELEIGRTAARGGKRRLALPEIGDISNLDEEGRLRERDDRRHLDSLGNRIWHTDASYMPVPVVLGMLYAVAVPRRARWAAARPNSPICARPMTHCRRR